MLKSTEMETINGLVSKMSLEDVKMVSGDRVSFNGRRGLTEGTVMKVNIKNVVVDCAPNGRWNVPASMLTKVA